jgi:hypothetical protein
MKWTIKIAAVLSWLNAIIWGLAVVVLLLLAFSLRSMPVIIFAFFLTAIVLHSYAALQLRRSIRNPTIKLSNQTPAGIRFVGFIALFIGAVYVANGIALVRDAQGSLQLMQTQGSEMFKTLTVASIREGGAVSMILGLCICANVFLNFRLLRWYYLVKQSDIS